MQKIGHFNRRFSGLGGLRTLLVSHKEDFVRTFTGKLLAYGIGRGIEYYDLPAIRKIARDAAHNDYRWSSIVLGVVDSAPFRMGISVGGQSGGTDAVQNEKEGRR